MFVQRKARRRQIDSPRDFKSANSNPNNQLANLTQTALCFTTTPQSVIMNSFLTAAVQGRASTENGAKAYASTGSALADQFAKASTFRGRKLADVFADQSRLVGENPVSALRFLFYNRLVTRKVNVLGTEVTATEKVQSGQGQRDESFKRYLWYAQNQSSVFYNNLWLMLTVGGFRDMWDLMVLAKEEGIKLDREKMYATYTELAQFSDLSKKFMPTLRPAKQQVTKRSQLRNLFGREYRDFLNITNGQYRQVKESGTAHEWQQMIGRKQLSKLNFGRIPGKALTLLTKGKFLVNQKMEDSYQSWIESQPVAKFTGYAYELLLAYQALGVKTTKHLLTTINKQFDGLIALAKQNNDGVGITGNVWCALDTSGSMSSMATGSSTVRAIDICKSLGIYFSTLNTGAFHKNVIMFDSSSKVKQLAGNFTDMVNQIPANAMGSTNFQSVVAEIIRIRTANPGIPVNDFPQTLVVVSDMQFNPANTNGWGSSYGRGNGIDYTNHELAVAKLSQHFPKEFMENFKFIWWDVTARETGNVPARLQDLNTYVYSGFDGSVITMLLGGEGVKVNGVVKKNPSMAEMIQATLDQEILTMAQA